MSTKNPFRAQVSPTPTPTPLGPLERPSSPPLPALPPPSPSTTAGPPSAIPHSSTAPAGMSTNNTGPSFTPAPAIERIDDDLPPAYTPSADPTLGEATVELGPRRPFQDPLRHPSSSPYAPTGPQQQQPQWHQPPGQSYHSQSQSRHPAWQLQPQTSQASWQTQRFPSSFGGQRSGGGLLGALFDTVRDVVEVVSGAHEERMIAAQRASGAAYATPYTPGQAPYGSPQSRAVRGQSPTGNGRSSAPPRSPPSVPDDGSPTRMPVPGHPLLRDGNLIVYPKDYLCVKCRNTGYKNYDPSHPCRKCWEKYGKPYTGALAYTSWSSTSSDPRMQRPLSKFVPPHLAGAGPSSRGAVGYSSPPPQHPQSLHSRSVSQPNFPTHPPSTGPSYYVTNPLLSMDRTPPVPHAISVPPGDPRLGGRLCMRCEGSGVRTLLLFDITGCDVCGGVGRVWT
ncbi:hypothetical protein HYDPIDRAFT_174870 [Hydnomerulius pinastri MD-312]|nr:hypothetical protein HYDPIDRAFT_174870 [Hydnomerulius pinastri MD-312]